MTAHLPAGQFFGRTVDSWRTPALALSESVYDPDTTLEPHAHARPYLCLVLQGGHRETSGSHVRDCGPATVVVHPAGERHANRFSSAGGHLFRLEFDE
jgi:AraC family transcriptional regulator